MRNAGRSHRALVLLSPSWGISGQEHTHETQSLEEKKSTFSKESSFSGAVEEPWAVEEPSETLHALSGRRCPGCAHRAEGWISRRGGTGTCVSLGISPTGALPEEKFPALRHASTRDTAP